jgi:hypothetical protein
LVGDVYQKKVSLRKVADLYFGIGYRRYQYLADEGLVPKPEKGKIDFFEAAKGIIAYYKKIGEVESGSSLTEERKKLVIVQRKTKEIELEKIMGALVSIEQVKKINQTLLTVINSHLNGLGKRWAGPLAILTDPRDVEDYIRKEISLILEEIRNASKKKR